MIVNCRFLYITLTSITLFCCTQAQTRLSRTEADQIAQHELNTTWGAFQPQAESIWANKKIQLDSFTMKFDYRIFGKKPVDGRSLYISLHGGGNAEASVNDQQWANQIMLYTPSEGVYVAPRAPTNTWMLWHENHIDDMLDELIRTAVVTQGVNPNKVYIMGYSAGGDGVFQLAPRMADRWAAASMMAGHPGDAAAASLRDLPFEIFMGGKDRAYNRNGLAVVWSKLLDSLQQTDPLGYVHKVTVYPDNAHWMDRKDTVSLSWMAKFKRDPLPKKIVWVQDDRLHPYFYWLGVPLAQAAAGKTLIVGIDGQQITISKNDYETFTVYLNDQLLNLDKKVTVKLNGKRIFIGRIQRNTAVIKESIKERMDKGFTFSAKLIIKEGKVDIL
ncbi:Dienelactone hydrolase family protein [bacterium A37T11]|nr:Dienelactone hydrolase family protein [bacterium A37T11]